MVDTSDGERMRLTVSKHVPNLQAMVIIRRPGGELEALPLTPSLRHHHTFTSDVAPAEPHEFDAVLQLSERD